MGYTHTWGYVPDYPRFLSAFPRIRDEATVILEHLGAAGLELAGPLGDGEPVLSDSDISFNGAGSGACETFLLTTEPIPRQRLQADSGRWFSWAFCKTDRMPYDLAVTAILLRAHQLVPDLLTLGSAGAWDHEWRPARELLKALFDADTSPCPLGDASRGPHAVVAAAQRL